VTVTVAGLAFARELRRAEPEQLNWWRLGLGAPPRLAAVTAPALVAVATGLLVALGGAWLLSTVGPVGWRLAGGAVTTWPPFITWAISARALSRSASWAAAGEATTAVIAATSQKDAVLLTKSLPIVRCGSAGSEIGR